MGSFQLLVKSVLLLLLVFLCMFKNSIATSSDDIKSFSNELTRKSHDAWIKSHDIALVYYHHRDRESNISESDSREIVRLIDVLERSANNLNKHGIHFAVAICEEISSTERCSSKKDPKDVAVYRHGVYMTELAPGVLFDEDAVISNCLELLLRDKVPLLQKPDQLRDHMTASIQKSSHFLFMIVHGIGAKEHSHLLQIAHHHTGSLTFAHSTSQNILDEFEINAQSSSAAKDLDLDNSQVRLLYFNCGKGSVAGKGACDIHHYLGSFKMAPLQVYMDMLEAPAGIPSEEAYKRKLPVTVCYYVDQSSKEKAEALTNQMSEEMKGSMLFYASNSESVRAGLKLNQSDTLCSIKAAEQHLAFSDYSRVRDDVLKLISRKPNEFKTSEDIEADALDELIEKVETRDDSVDLADQALGARKNLSLSHLVQLDRNTFMYEKFSGIVLFHIKKYDYMSRVALRLFDAAAARQAEVKYHSLDCYDWTDVCRKIGVSRFPTVRVYHEGDYSEYAGPTSVEGFTRLGFLSQFTAPLRVPSMAAMTRLNQTLEMSHFISGSIVLGLFKDDLSQEFKAFEEAAKTLIGQKLMVAAFDKLAERLIQKYRLPSLPALISLDLAESNPAKANKPFNKKVFCSPNMKNFALRSSLPSFVGLQ
ncbi:TXNDC16 [Bugula neritina]|uniref:TXNDC16 n=1 Tax=Bugula neritina TaxID=10212 RepID=A0A7J7JGR8_BUGNE|nr:TXNDC16 [Bugula neritina]